ncbi:general secretion pathway protein GspB [Rhizobacter sp. J219]|uniref:general secretion pathway protein GspB n=1 Tax=Rhizobacter sp. J219 TaxID=2898430 RepID=UPI0021509980|nr:general secretion pathway protein GspB [Rhizobacter sp. J219]MCR5881861.1 general secretion pathway protein GspB [Rhizobacter sp. J219]
MAAAPKPAPQLVENPAKAAAAPRDEDAPVPSISELPDDIRRQLPALSVSGASYSKNPASRMLILNGQVFREGDKVANDLVLEQIRLKSAVLSYRGRRYSVSF